MGYMHFISRFKPSTKKDLTTAAAIVSILLAGVCMLATYVFVHSLESQNNDEYSRVQQQQLHDTSTYVHNKLANYGQILLAGAAAVHIKGDDALTSSDWTTYVQTTHAVSAFPELLSIGYIQHVPAATAPTFVQQMQTSGNSISGIWPAMPRDAYDPIKFAEPTNMINQRAIGFDVSSEKERRESMAFARDTADFGLSPPITLTRDANGKKNPPQSVILFYPIYAGKDIPGTVESRREMLKGYVYLAFRIEDMMAKRNSDLDKRAISYTLTDISSNPNQMLYSYTSPVKTTSNRTNIHSTFHLISREWQVTMVVPETLLHNPFGPTFIFIAGLIASAILGYFVFMLLYWRIGSVKNEYEKDIENTKDELLALASHQLRTPATGVKQYLGMLLDGLFGDIQPDQRELIEKAYLANDLQLEIIDQLLYVAKADAGQLIVRSDNIDLKRMVKTAADNVKATAKQKRITIRTSLPQNANIRGDNRLISMILENLVSNAVKYSYEGKSVNISLKMLKTEAVVRVRDHGIGISEDDYPKLFQKFSRVTNEFSSHVEGSGLGLYLAAKLAEAHGGSIAVDSQVKKGSVFTLRLPVEPTKHSVVQLTEKHRNKS